DYYCSSYGGSDTLLF
nr:immunoglobulin light chain junction region [Macaca mulatta]MOW56506.1 immunoglobulin light chain junction region [Macaca mulatta]MOW57783.1 immunoglobulin light chain junction region [Macaca mulatta]MOW57848.1 immunoglobulin light chain junction region [Macaca mulatta]MOW57856.1 immunoglobulin light chain junction region [Macaca mulatta]